jgi:hypothetical protein
LDLLSIVTLAVGVFLLVDAINAGRTGRDRPPHWSELVMPAVVAGIVILLWVAWTAMAGLADLVSHGS